MTKERAIAVFEECKQRSIFGPWSDQLRQILTDEECLAVKRLWVTMPGYTSFCDAFLRFTR